MKFLCVCGGGIVRSGAVAWALRHTFNQGSVIQASHSYSPQEDLDMLGAWADYIVVVEAKFAIKFLNKFKDKVRLLQVGQDGWQNSLDPKLQEKVSEALQLWSDRNWKF